MNWNEILTTVLSTVVVGIIGAVTPLIIKGLKRLAEWLQTKTNSEHVHFLIGEAHGIVENAVVAANQTVVESLKDKNLFTQEAATEVKNNVIEEVKKSLTSAQVQAIGKATALTLEDWIKQQIEVAVNGNKKK